MQKFSEGNAESKKPGIREQRSREYRAVLEQKTRQAMAENPWISLKELRRLFHCENGSLSTIYHRIRRERDKQGG